MSKSPRFKVNVVFRDGRERDVFFNTAKRACAAAEFYLSDPDWLADFCEVFSLKSDGSEDKLIGFFQ